MNNLSIEVVDQFSDQMWRLSNLYTIVDKTGAVIPFCPNWAQLQLIEEMQQANSRRQLVLKVRQLGISTLIGILQLDSAMWTANFTAVTIAQDREAVEKLFQRNIKSVFDRLDEGLKASQPLVMDRSTALGFANGSSVSVGLSSRSGTVQLLHVSEFGKVCAKDPIKAKEIVTGAMESVPATGHIIVESTMEGHDGYYHDWCETALKKQQEGASFGDLEYRLTFLPWWKHPEYVARPIGVTIYQPLLDYFSELEAKIGQRLGMARRAWYAQKWATLGDAMKQEHPSTAEEAMEVVLTGTYYGEQMRKMRIDKRLTKVPHDPATQVHTAWDLGVDDATAIWFIQQVGREIRLIDFYQQSGEGLQHYAEHLAKMREKHGYQYGKHIGPHDLVAREFGSGLTRIDTARGLGIEFEICPMHKVADGIQAVRNLLGRTWIDKASCDAYGGVTALDSYRKKWDERRGTYMTEPFHDKHSHPADALRTFAMYGGLQVGKTAKREVKKTRRAY